MLTPQVRRSASEAVPQSEPIATPNLRKFASDAALAQKDGVFQLDEIEKELVHEHFTCDTRDHEDHTFCGIMFNCCCDTDLPAKYMEIQILHVRGDLGPMTVWMTSDTYERKREDESQWKKVYQGNHEPSPRPRRGQPVQYTALKLNEPVRLRPGESCGLYVHSALPGDEGIVYDNGKGHVTYQDRVLKLLPGCAHLSNRPFGTRGFWGQPWRTNREFVGRIEYGVRWKMWSPEVHHAFPVGFQQAVMTMIMASRRPESHMYRLQDEIVLFIMYTPRGPSSAAPAAPCSEPRSGVLPLLDAIDGCATSQASLATLSCPSQRGTLA